MVEGFQSDFWEIHADAARSLVVLRRSSKGFTSVNDILTVNEKIERTTSALARTHRNLIVDLRDSPMRNDPEFEQAMRGHPVRLMKPFARVALLVRTATGMLQIRRTLREQGLTVEAFQHEPDALAFLAAPAR